MCEEYHNQIVEYFPENYEGFFIDVGMSDPIRTNNTYFLEVSGWEGICIEPNERYFLESLSVRKNSFHFACGCEDVDNVDFTIVNSSFNEEGAISSLKVDQRLIESHKHLIHHIETKKVNVRKLDTILEMYENLNQKKIEKIDFLSIDTENTELDVLKGFDIQRWRPRLMLIENNFDEPYIEEYLRPFGYVKDKRYSVNDFYIFPE